MRNRTRVLAGILAAMWMVAPASLHADTVQLTLHDGRVSLVAENATPAQIFDAWSRAGGVLIVNANQMPSTPVTLTLENVPEEQALETLLRTVSGYLARRRTSPAADAASVFDRIVILPTPAVARTTTPAGAPAAAPANPNPVFPQPPRAIGAPQSPPAAQPPAATQNGVPQGPGVMRQIGPDGRPVEDDQADAPPPSQYNGGDAPNGRPAPVPRPVPVPPPQPQTQPPSTSAPAGVPRPGMVVPAPNTPGQPGSATPGQPTQQTQPPQQ
jgi:hypothetical protein